MLLPYLIFFFSEDFQKILYKIAVLETKCPSDRSRYGSEWTMWELHQSSMESEQQTTQQSANTWLISPNNDMGKQENYALGNKFKNIIPCCNTLGAKPKIKLFPSDMEDQVTGRVQRPEVCDTTGWSALSSERSASLTPKPRRKWLS